MDRLVVSWNINSIRARLPRVLDFCQRRQPDILCLQELKCQDDSFPADKFAEIGYRSVTYGQKQYNGVAIISKEQPVASRKVIVVEDDLSARWLEVTIDDLNIVSIYAPNGKELNSDKYDDKIKWFEKAVNHLQQSFSVTDDKVILAGDYNVTPQDLDVYDPQRWRDKLHCSRPEREALNLFFDLGYSDFFRHRYPDRQQYSWWDYRWSSRKQFSADFLANHGLRIDLILVSQALLPQCLDSWIETDERLTERPSDHAPVVLKINSEQS